MILQGQPTDILVRLTLASVPVTGVLFNQVTMTLWKNGSTTFAARAIITTDWVEVGNGYYVLKMNASDSSQLGMMLFKLNGGLFDEYSKELFVEPAPIALLVSPQTCIVSGNTLDLTGQVMGGKQVIFAPTDAPMAYNTSVVNYSRIISYTDALGNFSVKLLRGAAVIVEIPEAGLRAQFTVPDQSTALLLDLLPPIP
jgi:hypothetical protein